MSRKNILRLVLAATGAAAMALGIMDGQYREALSKAVYLCLECVGLG